MPTPSTVSPEFRMLCRVAGRLVAALLVFCSASFGQTREGAEKRWSAEYVSGTESLDRGADVTITVRKSEVLFQRKSEAFTIPSDRVLALTHQARTTRPVAEALGGAAASGMGSDNASDIAGGFLVGLLALATSGIRKHEHVVGLLWEESGVRSAAVVTLKPADGEALVEELQRVTGRQALAVEELTAEKLNHLQAASNKDEIPEAVWESPPEPFAAPPLAIPTGAPGPMQLDFEKVYDKAYMLARTPMLESDGERAYLIIDDHVHAFGPGRTVSKRFNDLPCPKRRPFFEDWRYLPGQGDVLALHCGALYLIDGATLAVKRKLLKVGNRRKYQPEQLKVAPAGGVAAVVVDTLTEPPMEVIVFDTNSGATRARWAQRHFSSMSFNSDGTFLVVYGLVHHVASGAIHAQIMCGNQRLMPVAGHPELIAGVASDSSIWNLATGDLIHRVAVDRPVDDFGKVFLSTDGRWLITTSHAGFSLHDPLTGSVLYDGKKSNTGILRHLTDIPILSRDGRYLLIETGAGWSFRYSLYRIAKRTAAPETPR